MFTNANVSTDSIFEKCGEITIAINVQKNIFAFNCIFCEMHCLQLEAFIEHIQETHYAEFNCGEEKLAAEDELQREMGKCERPEISKEESISMEIVKDPLEPLEEPPISICDIKQEDESTDYEHYVCEAGDRKIIKNEFHDNEDEYKPDTDSDAESDNELNPLATSCNVDDKQLTLAIIKEYKNHQVLWKEVAKKRRTREKALQQISNSINTQFSLDLTWQNISKRIQKMRSQFSIELKNQQAETAEGTTKCNTPIWYYDKLRFLTASVNMEQIQMGMKNNDSPSLPLPDMTDVENREFFEILHNFPPLWDTENICFRLKNQQRNSLQEMQLVFEEKFSRSITEYELQKNIYRTRYACTQEKKRKIHCLKNQEEFNPVCKFYNDICFLEDHIAPFKCDICEQILSTIDMFKVHMGKHTNSMPFICPVCTSGFVCPTNFKVHLRRHVGDFPFECSECGKRCVTSTELKIHMRSHTGEKPYFCETCGKSFRTSSFFSAHIKRHDNQRTHSCTLCSKSFFTNANLRNHMKVHLNIRDKVCDVCDKAFTNSKLLRTHKHIHAAVKRFVCKICGKQFAQSPGLNSHMKSHATTRSGHFDKRSEC